MRILRTRLLVTTLIALGSLAASACSAGPGGGAPIPTSTGAKEPAGGGGEAAGGGQDPPKGTGGAYEPPGTNGAYEPPGNGVTDTTGGGATGCLTCGTYSCVVSVNGQTSTSPLTLTPISGTAGACLVTNTGGLVLLCGGGVANNQSVTWTPSGGDGFSLSIAGTSLVCTLSSGVSSGGSSSKDGG